MDSRERRSSDQEKHGKRRALIPRIAVLRHPLQLVLTDPVHPVHFRADALLELLVVPLLFPVMLVTFTCYELGFEEYALLVPVFAVAGVVVLMIGALSYFLYDPYRMDRRNRKKANRYIVEIEKAAQGSASEGKGVREAGEKAGEVYQKGRGESAEEGRAGRAPQTAEGGAGRKTCTLARMVEREAGAA